MDYLKWYVENVVKPQFSPGDPCPLCGGDKGHWSGCPSPVDPISSGCRHEWLRPDNGVMECASCGATRFHYGD